MVHSQKGQNWSFRKQWEPGFAEFGHINLIITYIPSTTPLAAPHQAVKHVNQ